MVNITSLVGKESEFVCEVEMYQLVIAGLTSLHSMGSEISLHKRDWTLFPSGVAHDERCLAGVRFKAHLAGCRFLADGAGRCFSCGFHQPSGNLQ